MPIPTVDVTVRLFEIVGTDLPNAKVAFNFTRADVVAGNEGGIVPIGQTILHCDENGEGTIALFPNALGIRNTQYGVQVYTSEGQQVFPEKPGHVALTYIPNQDCLLHSVLFNIPPLSQDDANAAIIAAQAVIADAQQAVTVSTENAQITTDKANIATQAADTASAASVQAQALIHVGETPPLDAIVGFSQWIVPSTGKRYIYYDIDTWVEDAGFIYVDDAVSVLAAEQAAAQAGGFAGQADVSRQAAAADAGLAGTHRTAAEGSASSASISAAAAAASATAALAGGDIYPTTAAAEADVTLPNGSYYVLVTAGALSAALYRKDTVVSSTNMGYSFPSSLAIQLSMQMPPTGATYAEHDPNRMVTERLTTAGVRHHGALVANKFNSVAGNKVTETLNNFLTYSRMRDKILPYDINIVGRWNQSNGEGADSQMTTEASIPVPGVIMLDAIRPRTFAGARYQNGFTPAVEVSHNFGGTQFGTTGMLALARMVMKLQETEGRSDFRSHGKQILIMTSGRSSASIPQFGIDHAQEPPVWSDEFTLAVQQYTEAKRLADEAGLTIGFIGVTWYWGANAYDLNTPAATVEAQILQHIDDVDEHIIEGIFGQQRGVVPWGIQQSTAHAPRGYPNNPYVAETEAKLAREHARIDIINPEGSAFLEFSSTHHSAREGDIKGAEDGLWVWRRCVCKEKWSSMLPQVEAIDATHVRVMLPDIERGFQFGLKETGLPTNRRMQANYGLVIYDPSTGGTGTVQAQARQPQFDGEDIILTMTAPLPVQRKFRYSPASTFGNVCIVPEDDLGDLATTLTINGIEEPIERWMGIRDMAF